MQSSTDSSANDETSNEATANRVVFDNFISVSKKFRVNESKENVSINGQKTDIRKSSEMFYSLLFYAMICSFIEDGILSDEMK